jgi:hypothetical protein
MSTSNSQSFFKEKEEVLNLIGEIIENEKPNYEKILTRIQSILDAYQEQSQLLGPHLMDLLTPINSWLILFLSNHEDVSKPLIRFFSLLPY